MNKSLLQAVSVATLLILASTGCVSDVSRDPRYPTDYEIGAVYRARKPFVLESDALFASDSPIASIPHSEAQFQREGKERWPNVRGLVDTGSRLRVERIQLLRHIELGNWMMIGGRILDGRFAGETVQLWLISKETPHPKAAIYSVNTNNLERISP